MHLSNQRRFNRGDVVSAVKTLVATWDGRAIDGPAVSGVVDDDQGIAYLWIRANDGELHSAYREDIRHECNDCGETHGPVCPWLETCAECSRTDVAMQADRLCEDCGEEIGRASRRQQRRDSFEGHCDAMRDEQKHERAIGGR